MGNKLKLTPIEKTNYETNFLPRFREMMNEPPGSFFKYFQLLEECHKQMSYNPQLPKFVVGSTKATIKDITVSISTRIKALLFLKDCLLTQSPPLVHLAQQRTLKRLEKMATNPKQATQFHLPNSTLQDKQLADDFQRLILECMSQWSVLLSPINNDYRARWKKVQSSIKQPNILPEEIRMYHFPPRPNTGMFAGTIVNTVTETTTIIRSGMNSNIPMGGDIPISTNYLEFLRREAMQILLKDQIDQYQISDVLRRFDETPMDIRQQAPNETKFFNNLKEITRDQPIDRNRLYPFMVENSQNDPEQLAQIQNRFGHQIEPDVDIYGNLQDQNIYDNLPDLDIYGNLPDQNINDPLPNGGFGNEQPDDFNHITEMENELLRRQQRSMEELEARNRQRMNEMQEREIKSQQDVNIYTNGVTEYDQTLRNENEILSRNLAQAEREKRELEMRIQSLRGVSKDRDISIYQSHPFQTGTQRNIATSGLSNSKLRSILAEQVSSVETLSKKVDILENQLNPKTSLGPEPDFNINTEAAHIRSAVRKRLDLDMYDSYKPGLARSYKGTGQQFLDNVYSNIDQALRRGKKIVY